MRGKIVVTAAGGEWQDARIPGVAFKVLRAGADKGAGTFLIRMEPGAEYPAHVHPGGEEVWVVEGRMRVGGDDLAAGDYLFTPPGGSHDAGTAEGCLFLVVLPEPIRRLR